MMMTAMAVALQLVTTAAKVTVSDGEEITVPVPQTGVTLQLPGVVRVVTPAGDYVVKPLVPPRPAPARGQGKDEGAEASGSDVRVVLVRPSKPAAGEQSVSFLLVDNRSVTVRLIPGSPRDDSFVDVRWGKRLAGTSAGGRGGGQFLASERALMLAMLRDEAGYGRKQIDRQVELPGYPNLEVVLVRSYEADGLFGAVYTFTNKADTTVVVNPTVLAVGKPNRAVLTQMDHEELRPCDQDKNPDPRGTGCTSLVRVVARREGDPGDVLDRAPSPMPFVVGPPAKEKR